MNPQRAEALKTAFTQNHVEFLETEIAICSTFIDMARSRIEAGDREAAVRLAEKSDIARRAIERFLGKLEDDEKRAEIKGKLTDLRVQLDGLQERLER